MTISEAEPIGPKNLFDALVILPCTGNTLAKLANGITDTPALMGRQKPIYATTNRFFYLYRQTTPSV